MKLFPLSQHRIILLVFLLLSTVPLFGNPAASLLDSSSLLGTAEKAIYSADMEIFNGNSSKSRKLIIYRETSGSDVFNLLAQVTSPAFLSNMKLLVLKDGQQESRWMKTSRGVRSIASSGRKERIFDSDLDTDDLVDIESSQFSISLVKDLGTEICLSAREIATGFSRTITVDQDSQLITHIDYYDANNILYKTYELLETTIIEGYAFPQKGRISSIKDKTHTDLTFTSIELPTSISTRIFNRHQL